MSIAPVKTPHLGISRPVFFIALSPAECVKAGDLLSIIDNLTGRQ
jgi:hypothetical protein